MNKVNPKKQRTCPVCFGKGDFYCEVCHGKDYIEEEVFNKYTGKIQAGSSDNFNTLDLSSFKLRK